MKTFEEEFTPDMQKVLPAVGTTLGVVETGIDSWDDSDPYDTYLVGYVVLRGPTGELLRLNHRVRLHEPDADWDLYVPTLTELFGVTLGDILTRMHRAELIPDECIRTLSIQYNGDRCVTVGAVRCSNPDVLSVTDILDEDGRTVKLPKEDFLAAMDALGDPFTPEGVVTIRIDREMPPLA